MALKQEQVRTWTQILDEVIVTLIYRCTVLSELCSHLQFLNRNVLPIYTRCIEKVNLNNVTMVISIECSACVSCCTVTVCYLIFRHKIWFEEELRTWITNLNFMLSTTENWAPDTACEWKWHMTARGLLFSRVVLQHARGYRERVLGMNSDNYIGRFIPFIFQFRSRRGKESTRKRESLLLQESYSSLNWKQAPVRAVNSHKSSAINLRSWEFTHAQVLNTHVTMFLWSREKIFLIKFCLSIYR